MCRLGQINALHTVKEKSDLEEWSRAQSNICIIIFYYYIRRIVNTIYIHLSPTCPLVSDLCWHILWDKICKRRQLLKFNRSYSWGFCRYKSGPKKSIFIIRILPPLISLRIRTVGILPHREDVLWQKSHLKKIIFATRSVIGAQILKLAQEKSYYFYKKIEIYKIRVITKEQVRINTD